MTTKKKPKALSSPIVPYIPPTLPAKADNVPPYQDVGTEYEGYSKKPITQGGYELKTQTPIKIIGNVITGTTTIYTVPAGKKLFLKAVNFSRTGAAGTTLLRDGTDTTTYDLFDFYQADTNVTGFNFDVPLQVNTSVLINIAGAAIVFYNLYGWIE